VARHDAAAPIEAELLQPPPRRPRWRLSRSRWWLRLALLGPPTLVLGWALLESTWLFVLAVLGTPLQASVVDRRANPEGYTVTVEYPGSGDPAEPLAREVLDLPPSRWGALLRTQALPARRLGRGSLAIVRVETDGQPLRAWDMGLWLGLGVAPAVFALWAVMWGRVAREIWLVAWGRPVRGQVSKRAQRGKFVTQYIVSYEYRETTERGGSAILYGSASVSRVIYEATHVGQALTVLHALWNPRLHTVYRFARFEVRG
jgi:hypothetical protein